MISTSAQALFAAEFATFLVATAGLLVVALRADLLSRDWWSRIVLVLGFGTLAAVAYQQGSTVTAKVSPTLAIIQAAGLVAVAIGTLRWSSGPTGRKLLWLGLVLMAASIAFDQAGTTTAGDIALGGGALALGLALLAASRRAVAARVAASAAGTLLVFGLVLSVALSTQSTRTIQDQLTRRVAAQASLEAGDILGIGQSNAIYEVRFADGILGASSDASDAIRRLAASPNAPLDPALNAILSAVQNRLPDNRASLLYVSATGHILGIGAATDANLAELARVVGAVPVQQTLSRGTLDFNSESGSVELVGTNAVAVGVRAVGVAQANGVASFPGVIISVQNLDDSYLALRARFEPKNTGLALLSRSAPLATAGVAVSGRNVPVRQTSQVLALGSAALDANAQTPARVIGGRYVVASPVVATDGRPVMALIASTPASDVTSQRDKVFRILFGIALGGTLLALLMAALVGERIGAGLRTLTQSAQRIQRGDYAEPSGVRTDDEVGVLGLAFDSMAASISEQTAALQRAAEDETALRNQLQAVVAGMGEALVAVGPQGRVTLVNRAAEELLDVHAGDAIGQPVGRVIRGTGADGSDIAGRLKRSSPARWSALANLRVGEGDIPVAVSAGALRGPADDVVGAVFVLRDLRPERAVERMKNEFLSRIGHELRTPLTAILGYADILLRRKFPEPQSRQFHTEIADAARRLSRIVEMLEFSAAAEAGRSLMRPERLTVRSLVDGVVSEWEGRLNGNHAIGRRVARGLPDVVGDRRWLAVSLNELVDNAVKFSPEGGKIGVVAGMVEVDGRQALEISVIDQGLGMPRADLDRVFAEFAQADASDTRRFGGLGLGLSMVKRVAEAHGGTVTCASSPRTGSKFSIVLPV